MAAVDAETASTTLGEVRSFSDVSQGYTTFLDGDLLVAKITPCFENGKIAQARLAHRLGFGSTEFHVVRPRADTTDARYLLHFLRQGRIRRDGERKMTGSGGQRRVPEHFLAGLQVPVRSLPEQRRLAEMLDRVDALRAKRRTALAQLDALSESLFLDMFGDPALNTRGLPLVALGSLGEWKSGGTPPRARKDFFDGPIPWFSSGELGQQFVVKSREHISPTALRETSAKKVPRGALLLGMYDTAALKAAIAGVDCSCNQAIAFSELRPQLVDSVYVYFAITIGREHFRRLQRGVRQKNLNLSMVREIRIPLPPLTQQIAFATHVAAIEHLRKSQLASHAQVEALSAALQEQAFCGRP
jgi:type I restriction enzyme S subunit